LKDALISYEGTMLLVSHDRDFLDGLSNKIWEIQDGKIRTHYFGVNEFLERINFDDMSSSIVTPIKKENKVNLQLKKEDKFLVKKLENQVKKLERDIESIENNSRKTDELEATQFLIQKSTNKLPRFYITSEQTKCCNERMGRSYS